MISPRPFYIQLKENKEIIMCLISHCWDRREGNWPLLWLLLCVPRVATNVLFHPRFGIETAKAFQEAEGCNIHLINGPICSKLKLVLQKNLTVKYFDINALQCGFEKSSGHRVKSTVSPEERKKQSCDLSFYQTQIGEVSSGPCPMIQTRS